MEALRDHTKSQGVRPSFLGFQCLMEALRDHTDAGI
jgi:hypothetical protein